MNKFCKQGFTLIEVMVALLVVGIALPALLAQIVTQLEGGAHLRDRAHGRWVAENQLNLIILERQFSGNLPAGQQQGSVQMLGRTWYWRADSLNSGMPGMWLHRVSAGLSLDHSLISIEGLSSQDQPMPALAGAEQ